VKSCALVLAGAILAVAVAIIADCYGLKFTRPCKIIFMVGLCIMFIVYNLVPVREKDKEK
jgi:hypothetical protein